MQQHGRDATRSNTALYNNQDIEIIDITETNKYATSYTSSYNILKEDT